MAQIDEQNNIIHGSQKLIEGFEHYIIKFPNSNDGLNIGKIEYIYSLMAKKANIEIPKTKLLKGKKNSYFTIKRFDRIKDNRLHIHSVAGLTHSDFRIPSLDYDDLLTLCFHLTKDINEVKKLFRLAVFNLFTHNRDDHAKNFSFMLDEKNSWKLTPAYDLTFSYVVGTEHSTTYLNEGKNPNIDLGLTIGEVASKSEAYDKGLMVGDIVLSANQNTVNSVDYFRELVKDSYQKNKKVFLFLKRGENNFAVALSVK